MLNWRDFKAKMKVKGMEKGKGKGKKAMPPAHGIQRITLIVQ